MLRQKFTITFGVLLIMGLAGIVTSAQQSYELRCYGGGMKMTSTLSPMDRGMYFIKIFFTPGKEGAAPKKQKMSDRDILAGRQQDQTPNLEIKQCSWVDRGFRKGEPGVLSIVGTRDMEYKLRVGLAYAEPQYWRFCAYTTDKGYLYTTRQERWDPYGFRTLNCK